MSIPQPKRRDISNRIKRNSASLRLWHWLNTIIISGSLITVLLNSTVLKSGSNAALIQKQLAKSGATVTNDQARSAVHAISDKVWAVHIYFGYTLAGLLLFRLLLEFFQLSDQKLIRRIKSAYHHYIQKKQQETAMHEFWVKTLYLMFYLMLLVMVLTGLSLAFEDNAPLLKAMHWIRGVHSFTMYLILAFIGVHLAGVFLAERKDSPGIISDMINGGRQESEQ